MLLSDREEELVKCLTNVLSTLASEIHVLHQQRAIEFEWFRLHSHLATKNDLREMEQKIMSAISDFAANQKTYNQRQGAAIDSVVASAAGLTADVKELNDKITALQNSPGGVTPEDQALINEIQAEGEALATRSEAVSAALKALDEQTPPVVPPVPV